MTISLVGLGLVIVLGIIPNIILLTFFLARQAGARNLIRTGEKVPGFSGVRQHSVKGVFKPNETAQALELFSHAWTKEFGKDKDINSIFNKLDIFWTKDVIDLGQEYNIGGRKFSTASGVTDSPSKIRVWISDGKISSTALAHELVHVALWKLHNAPDYDHEGDLAPGWTKQHTKIEGVMANLLREKGL